MKDSLSIERGKPAVCALLLAILVLPAVVSAQSELVREELSIPASSNTPARDSSSDSAQWRGVVPTRGHQPW